MGYEGFPLIVGWELTLACNLRCAHCGSTAGQPRDRELSLREALAICDQLPDLLVCEVDFTGGEPLCRSDWPQIAKRLCELDIKTKLITNGLLLGPEVVARMKDAGIACVGVSVDGLEPTHDHIRKHQGLFRTILAGIEFLQRAGIPVTVITTVNALNVGQLPALLGRLRSIGVDRWQFQPIFPLGRARECAALALNEMDYLHLGEFARDFVFPDTTARPALLPGDSFGYYTEVDRRQPAWGGCSAGMFVCGITSNGGVKGCLSMPDNLVEDSLRRRDLWDIWFDDASFRYNRGFSTAELGPNCRSCSHAEECRGGCSSMSYACTGRFHNDPYCFYRLHQRGGTDFASTHIPVGPTVETRTP